MESSFGIVLDLQDGIFISGGEAREMSLKVTFVQKPYRGKIAHSLISPVGQMSRQQ
jgi:hypothetical protein